MLISNWRQDWKLGDFPFYYAQIAPYQYSEGTNSQYLREAQMQSLSVPHTGMAVTMDIASLSTVHPPNKQDVGERLARWALANDYGRKIPFSGPIYQSMEKVKNKIILRFNYADQGLVIKPIEGKTCFQIAGSDQKFRDALIEIKGSTLVISAPGLNDPIAVRYAWSDTALGTLFNREGLPASSFRTDQFKPGAGL